MHTVQVSWKATERAAAGHPWLFASDVTDHGGATAGEAVRVVDPKQRAIGLAHYSASSQITLRLLAFGAVPQDAVADGRLNPAFLLQRIGAALDFRHRIVGEAVSYRMVHAEADLLPGLIVDRYGDYVVLQTLTQGMDRSQADVADALCTLLRPKGIVARNDAPVRQKEQLERETRVVMGDVPPLVMLEMNRLAWRANLIGGQKTGLFLDQRENYAAVARHAAALTPGGRALDCFTSTGGFALHLAESMEHVEAVDSSAEALATAQANAEANGIRNVTFREADVFDLLAGYNAAKRRFHAVVLDPPAFAKSRQSIPAALKAYKEINLRALRLLPPGGLLVTCSCSYHVSEAALLEVVAVAANETSRTLRVIDRRTQAADHPILLTVPETHYLKCLVLQVL